MSSGPDASSPSCTSNDSWRRILTFRWACSPTVLFCGWKDARQVVIYDVDTFLSELVPEFGRNTHDQLFTQLLMFGFYVVTGDYCIARAPAKWCRASHPLFGRVSPDIYLLLNQPPLDATPHLSLKHRQFEDANREYLAKHTPALPSPMYSSSASPEASFTRSQDSYFQQWLGAFAPN